MWFEFSLGLRCIISLETWIWALGLGFGPWGWDFGLKTEIWASRLGFEGGWTGEIYTSSTSTTMGIVLSLNCQVLERHIWDVKLKWKISSYLLTILNYIADNHLTPVYLTSVGGVVKTLIVPVLKVLKIHASLRFAWMGYITYIPNANLVKQKRKGLINLFFLLKKCKVEHYFYKTLYKFKNPFLNNFPGMRISK